MGSPVITIFTVRVAAVTVHVKSFRISSGGSKKLHVEVASRVYPAGKTMSIEVPTALVNGIEV
jgi:hypothetical protein